MGKERECVSIILFSVACSCVSFGPVQQLVLAKLLTTQRPRTSNLWNCNERDKQEERQTQTERDRDRETKRETERDRDRDRDGDRETETERERKRDVSLVIIAPWTHVTATRKYKTYQSKW